MKRLAPLLLIALLPACGMKGDLYETAPAATAPATSEPVPTDPDERKSIPAEPDPARSQ